ncbi:hypothetical protein IW492_09550 [Enterococcus sp. BWB1-3]|uniref:pectate lyase-like adhesive domain-containing protein n=1 Tax=unclassified Enterococcus TaxID=2608891 RepID=UPI001921D3E6|nr:MULTISPECIES: pectate lyase-like adhesive domain-containing protein [unclassified Enterococcus]MBL1229475.1 hypothetical protein [Enterococcus sp. BWB1-3]MCB5952649.1 hypothetical protein [Enterococcus sp. BWT-B8]MCB5956325.1 hypothetical protein [Enterococcus sp. CWB-B31]
MKKARILKHGLLTLATVAAISAVTFGAAPGTPLEAQTVEAAASGTVEVSTFAQFESALKDVNTKVIIVTQSIAFNKNVTHIPNRDVEIRGRKGQGVVINSGHFSIYGKQNTKGKNTLTIKNARIIGDSGNGRFFTGGAGNGPLSYGWDVVAQNVNYDGARFVHLSEGKLTFSGTNVINTRAENAWVHDLEFEAGSTYTGIAANKDHSQFSAFYFNGSLVNCKANGEVKIGDGATVNVKIGPQSNVNYYYPVFYDKVHKVDVGVGATLDVDAAGTAFGFIPRANYVNKAPSLNLASGAKAYFNGRGGGNYPAVYFQYYGAQLNMEPDSEFVATGNSTIGTFRSEYKGAVINLNAPANFEVTNKKAGAKLFYSTDTTINATGVNDIYTWTQVGGEYLDAPSSTFSGGEFAINFGKICNSKTLSVTGDLSQQFKMENYGKISLQGSLF